MSETHQCEKMFLVLVYFDCLCLKAGASNAANIISATYIVTGERYHGSSVIVD